MVSRIFYFHAYLGKWSNLTNIFQLGWFNHQLENAYPDFFYPGQSKSHLLRFDTWTPPKHSWNTNLRRCDWARFVELSDFMSTSVLALDLLVGSWTWWETLQKVRLRLHFLWTYSMYRCWCLKIPEKKNVHCNFWFFSFEHWPKPWLFIVNLLYIGDELLPRLKRFIISHELRIP